MEQREPWEAKALKDFHETLEELEKAGWPFRLVELPGEYRKLEQKLVHRSGGRQAVIAGG